jgi:CRISPR-associated protein Cas2
MVAKTMDEQRLLVVYDVPSDRIRARFVRACKDFGLERFQFSAFRGSLSRNKREELFVRLARELRDEPGKILVVPLCEKDARNCREVVNLPTEEDET